MNEIETQQKSRSRLRRVSLVTWLRLLRIMHRNEQAAAEHLRGWNLTHAQFDVLAQLGSAGDRITQSDLAARLLVTQGNITQLLDRMEQRGLVQRCPEGRSNLLSLTPEGWEMYDEVVPAHEEWQAERLSALTVDEQRQLLSLLDKLDRAQRG
jgi:DNA-binding MarR family transcriptional regulator